MGWVRLPDEVDTDPDVADMPPAAFKWHVRALAFSNRHLLDGSISRSGLRSLGVPKRVQETLILKGWWLADGERGVTLLKFIELQQKRAEVLDLREKRRRAGQAGGQARAKASASGVLKPPSRPVPSRPEEPPSPPEGASKQKNRRQKTLIPEPFEPSESVLLKAGELGFSRQQELETREEFVDYWRSEGRLKADWNAAYRNQLKRVARQQSLAPRAPSTVREAYQRRRAASEAGPSGDVVGPPETVQKALGLFGGDN